MARRKKGLKIDGWINLKKPLGVTSTSAVNIVRRAFKAQKAGHAGTLDPLASGVLPIALGEATKTIPYIQDAYKIYEFTSQWGAQTTTDDMEGEIVSSSELAPTQNEIELLLSKYIGDVQQTPPKFSAIRINGERAYDMARDGQDVEIPSRPVYIESLEIIGHDAEKKQTSFKMKCGKGTYVRSIARDLGLDLGCFGHVCVLTRTQVGCFSMEETISLDIFKEMDDNTATDGILLPVETVLDDIPALSLTQQEASRLMNGQMLTFVTRPDTERLLTLGIDFKSKEDVVALALLEEKALGLVTIKGVTIKPSRLFNL